MVKDPSVEQTTPTMEDLAFGFGTGLSVADQPNIGPKALLRLIEDEDLDEDPHRFYPLGFSVDCVHERLRRNDETPEKMSRLVRLDEVFGDPKYGGQEFEYSYEFGDDWWHKIEVVGRRSQVKGSNALAVRATGRQRMWKAGRGGTSWWRHTDPRGPAGSSGRSGIGTRIGAQMEARDV